MHRGCSAFSRQSFINRLGDEIYFHQRCSLLDKVFLRSVNSFRWDFVGQSGGKGNLRVRLACSVGQH
ncbi:hypothetical protein D6029_01355 [Buttiauxella izardii]|uniref:Uncharacterized protein n=1 Tax=Buttiauxella izardii TaxID=82991 RepID=A0A3A5JXQ1_9ENTR|nr:hypothetical protein D6029_01355 [Buttiauxella izardii]